MREHDFRTHILESEWLHKSAELYTTREICLQSYLAKLDRMIPRKYQKGCFHSLTLPWGPSMAQDLGFWVIQINSTLTLILKVAILLATDRLRLEVPARPAAQSSEGRERRDALRFKNHAPWYEGVGV